MAARQKGDRHEPKPVPRSVTLDGANLARAGEVLGAAEVLRLALDPLQNHFPEKDDEEE
jgi:hypothetical protein